MDDLCWISSYPRSGNRLLSEIIHFIVNEKGKFRETVPDFHQTGLNKSSKFCKIHKLYKHLPFKDCRIIYLLRNPLDILISSINYIENFQKKRFQPIFIEEFIEKEGYIDEWREYGSYSEHVHSFLLNPKISSENLLIIQYENLISNKVEGIIKIIKFLNYNLTANKVEWIADQTCFSKVKSQEPENILLHRGKCGNNHLYVKNYHKSEIVSLYNQLIDKINNFRKIDLVFHLNES
jgi:hypothetical protein